MSRTVIGIATGFLSRGTFITTADPINPGEVFGAISDPQGRSLVGTKGYVLSGVTSNAVEGNSATYRTKHQILKPCTGLQFMYQNVQVETGGANNFDLKLAIEIEDPVSKVVTRYPLYWDEPNTLRTKTFLPGNVNLTAPLPYTFTQKTNVWLRAYISVPASGTWPRGGPYMFNIEGEGKVLGSDLCDFDQSTNPVLASGNGDPAGSFWPFAIIGVETGGPTVSMLLSGDSIQANSSDDSQIAKAPWQQGFGVRMCHDYDFPFSNIAVSGENGLSFQLNHTNRALLAPFATHVICNYGTNDWGATLSAMQDRLTGVWGAFKTANPNIRVYHMKILGRNASNSQTVKYNVWYDPGNVRDQVNDWISTAPYGGGGVDGYFDGAYITEQQNPRTGLFRTPGYTTDGTHPIGLGHDLIHRSIDGGRIKNFQSFAPVGPMVPSQVTGLTVSSTDTEAFLYWDDKPATDFYLYGYNVYRNGTKITSVPIKDSAFYYDSGLTAATQYTYEVTAVSIFDVESPKVGITTTPNVRAIAVQDTFERVASATLGDVETGVAGSLTWGQNSAGKYSIVNDVPGTGVGAMSKVTTGATQYAYVETGLNDLDMSVTHKSAAATQGANVFVRYVDTANYINLVIGNTVNVSSNNAGVSASAFLNSAALAPSITSGSVHQARFVVFGPTVYIFHDGVLALSGKDSRLVRAGTKIGFNGFTLGQTFDNLTVRKLS